MCVCARARARARARAAVGGGGVCAPSQFLQVSKRVEERTGFGACINLLTPWWAPTSTTKKALPGL